MKIRIVISNPTEWYKQLGSWVIRKFDGSSGSHVSVFLETYAGIKVYESVWPMSQKLTHAAWSKHNEFVKEYVFEVLHTDQLTVLEFLETCVNKPYSVPQLALIAADYFVPVSYKNINGQTYLICSELAADVLLRFCGAKFDECTDTIGVLDIERECERLI